MKTQLYKFINNNYNKELYQEIIINNHKQPIKPFVDRYLNFLWLNKGSKMDTKDDLILLLNKKPRSFLSRLQSMVRTFEYSYILSGQDIISKKQHPKDRIIDSKIQYTLNGIHANDNSSYNSNIKSNNILRSDRHNNIQSIDSYSLVPLSKTSKIKSTLNKNILLQSKSGLITAKSENNILGLVSKGINSYIQLLKKSNLTIPFNLLNPLLKQSLPSIKNKNIATLRLDLKKLLESDMQNKNLERQSQSKPSIFKVDNSIDLGYPFSSFMKNIFIPSLLKEKSLHLPWHNLRAGGSAINKNKKDGSLYRGPSPSDEWNNILLNNKLESSYFDGKTWQSKKIYPSTYNYFNSLLTRYYEYYPKNITLTKYFQLITPYKYIKPFHQNIHYFFNKYNKLNQQQKDQIFKLLEYAFRTMSCLISKPVFMETQDNIIIHLFYFFIPGKVDKYKQYKRMFSSPLGSLSKKKGIKQRKSVPIVTSLNGIEIKKVAPAKPIKITKEEKEKLRLADKKKPFKQLNQFIISKNINKLNKLCIILSKIFKKPVKLDLIPLSLPFFDDNILVKAIGILSKKIPVRTFFNFIYRNTKLYSKITAHQKYRYSITRSFIAGIKIKIGGRLMTQRVIPKISSRVIQRGPTAVGKVNFVDWSRINLKNRRGSHSITVKMSHVI